MKTPIPAPEPAAAEEGSTGASAASVHPADAVAPLVGGERVIVTAWWCLGALLWLATFGGCAGAILAWVSQ